MAGVAAPALDQLLQMIGAPSTPSTLGAFADWMKAEGGTASYNPFNTTEDAPGATDYNGVGVKNYPSLNAGISATANTLLNGHYQKLVSDLRSGKASTAELTQDVAQSPWGTGSLIEKVAGSIPSQTAAPTSGAPMPAAVASPAAPSVAAGATAQANQRQALLGLLMSNNQSIMSGQSPSGNALAALENLAAMNQQSQATPSSPATAKPTAAPVGQGGSQAEGNIIDAAKSFLGTPYVYGGNNPKTGLDCSAFVQQAMAKVGITLPRTTTQQYALGQAVPLHQIQPGDVVFLEPGKGPSGGPGHEGLYIGNGQVQESPHTGTVNQIVPLNTILKDGLVGVRRYA